MRLYLYTPILQLVEERSYKLNLKFYSSNYKFYFNYGGDKMIGIYKILNSINNKIYIGQSINIESRFKKHISNAYKFNSACYNYPLYRSIRKYGLDNFIFSILEECDQENLNSKEIYWISIFNSNDPEFGYNLTQGGNDTNYLHKITFTIANEIILLLQNTDLTQQEIAEDYGLGQSTISAINTGLSWKREDVIYPIREQYYYKQYNFCTDCGKPISLNAIRCNECNGKIKRIIERPSRDQLKVLIRSTSFSSIGKKYNVSDNAIRKWCKSYNLPYRVSDIKNIPEEEWNKI